MTKLALVGASNDDEAELDAMSARVAEAYPPRVRFADPPPALAYPVIDQEVEALRRAIAAALVPGHAGEVDLSDLVYRLGKIEDALAGLQANQGRLMERIIVFVSFATSVHPREMSSDRKTKPLFRARWAVMWGTKRFTDHSLPLIGKRLGGMDHTSVIHGLKRAEELRETDAEFRGLTDALERHFLAVTAPEATEEDVPCLPLS